MVKVTARTSIEKLRKQGIEVFDMTETLSLILVLTEYDSLQIYLLEKTELRELMEKISDEPEQQ